MVSSRSQEGLLCTSWSVAPITPLLGWSHGSSTPQHLPTQQAQSLLAFSKHTNLLLPCLSAPPLMPRTFSLISFHGWIFLVIGS